MSLDFEIILMSDELSINNRNDWTGETLAVADRIAVVLLGENVFRKDDIDFAWEKTVVYKVEASSNPRYFPGR